MSFSVNNYFKDLTEDKEVLLAHKGSITSDLINKILDLMENKLMEANEQSKTRKKIYNVLVESLQNLYHHVDELPDEYKNQVDPKFGTIIIVKDNDKYIISIGNFIRSTKIKFLKDKIDKINSLSREELKDMYKFILNHQKLSAKGGGGLGLVDIARKTGNKLNYTFLPVNDEFYFFNLDIYIN
jgi:hypothetical protein